MRGYPKSPRSHSDRRRQLCGQHLLMREAHDLVSGANQNLLGAGLTKKLFFSFLGKTVLELIN